jgi:hypothetical protein
MFSKRHTKQLSCAGNYFAVPKKTIPFLENSSGAPTTNRWLSLILKEVPKRVLLP